MFTSLLDRPDLPVLVLAIDTMYKLGDFFVTPITYRHTEFQDCPIMALAYLFHQRRYEREHDMFLQSIVEAIPALKTSKRHIFVSDEETGLVKAITNNLPDSERFRCIIHGWNNVKRKLRALGIHDQAPLKLIKEQFWHLLSSASEQEYSDRLLAVIPEWNGIHPVRKILFNAFKAFFIFYSVCTGFLPVLPQKPTPRHK